MILDNIVSGDLHIEFADRGRDPANGLDCWGLVCHVYAQDLGITLPPYDTCYASSWQVGTLEPLIREKAAIGWLPVNRGHERAYDLAHMMMQGRPVHVGIVARPGLIVHVVPSVGTALERYPDPSKPNQVLGIYRLGSSQSLGTL